MNMPENYTAADHPIGDLVSRFEPCWTLVLREENGDWYRHPQDWASPRCFSNTPHDTGGATMDGIIQREYDHYRKLHVLHTQSVRQISLTEGEWIYRNLYWLPHCPNLPPGLDLSFFDSSVNEGSTEALKILQHSLGLDADGVWGPETASVVARTPPAEAVRLFTARRHVVYHLTKGDEYFDRDWQARATRIEKASLGMAAPIGPAGDRGQVGWMGGEFDR